MNRAGRLVLYGTAPTGRVKIYEAMCAEHADFILEVTARATAGGRFPNVLGRSEQFIVCDWVLGRLLADIALSPSLLRSLARLQASIHNLDVRALPAAAFDYWENLVRPRFTRASALVGREEVAREAIQKVSEWRSTAKWTVNHPDLTLVNVIVISDECKPIDNELLYAGPGAFMDILNTLRSIPVHHRFNYLDAYRHECGEISFPEEETMRAFWLSRDAGAAFAAGDIAKLQNLFDFVRSSVAQPDDLVSTLVAWRDRLRDGDK